MITIHEAYTDGLPPKLIRFEGARKDLEGGEFMGYSAPYALLEPGDLITCVPHDAGLGPYYYDPELRVPGNHYVRVEQGWQRLNLRRADQ